ncbi:MAG: hypothetical protein RR280_01040 [Bacteroidaceae bacterium]
MARSKKVLNKSRNQLEAAVEVKCPRCSGFGAKLGDEGVCPTCNGYGNCWKTESGWTLAPFKRVNSSQLY